LRKPLPFIPKNFKETKMNIIKLSITRPTVVIVTFTLFVLFGLLSYSRLSQELFPKINLSTITLIALTGSLSLAGTGFIGSVFASTTDQGQFIIALKLPRDATIEQTNDMARETENFIHSNPVVKTVFSTVGAEKNGQPQAHLAEIRVKMLPESERTVSDTDLAQEMRLALQRHIAGAKITTATSELMGDVDDAPIQYFVLGNSMNSVLSAANRLLESMSAVRRVMDAKISVEAGNPEISIIPDHNKTASLGVEPGALGLNLYDAFNGNTDAKFRDGNNEYDIHVRLDRFDRRSNEDVENFALINVSGNPVRL
jgi:HAE1 family hydrophobic/amphiphilic exporter-1